MRGQLREYCGAFDSNVGPFYFCAAEWIQIEYSKGKEYGSHCNNEPRRAHIMITCDQYETQVSTVVMMFSNNDICCRESGTKDKGIHVNLQEKETSFFRFFPSVGFRYHCTFTSFAKTQFLLT